MSNRILIIDDNRMNTKILNDILTQEHYKVNSILDATLVMDTVQDFSPDAILLDIVMPVIDGIQVCKMLKDNDSTMHIPIIMVTSVTDSNILKNAFEIGAFDYIKKPLDPIEVIARIKSALRYSNQQKELEFLANKDGLTNLYNHRAILELANKELESTVHTNSPFSFLMVDIDSFKKINDTYGHRTGDYALSTLGNLFLHASDSYPYVGRYGGEEFCLVFPNESLENIIVFCEYLLNSIEKFVFEFEGTAFHLTVSMGLAHNPASNPTDLNLLIKNADLKLYQSKSNGKNQLNYIVL